MNQINDTDDLEGMLDDEIVAEVRRLESEVARLMEIAGRLAATVAWVADGQGQADGMRERAAADLKAWHDVQEGA